MAKRSSTAKLVIMIVVSVTLFMGLALGEDYGRNLLKKWRSGSAVQGPAGEIADVVKRYDQVLAEAYEQDKPSLLQEVATEDQIKRVRLYMTYEQVEEERRIRAALRNLTIDKIDKKAKTAAVFTTETWEYRYESLADKKESDRIVESYTVRYDLIKSGGNWLIDQLDVKPPK